MIKSYTSLRLPSDAKAFIESEARENASSQNSEIVRAIRAAMKAKQREAGKGQIVDSISNG